MGVHLSSPKTQQTCCEGQLCLDTRRDQTHAPDTLFCRQAPLLRHLRPAAQSKCDHQSCSSLVQPVSCGDGQRDALDLLKHLADI